MSGYSWRELVELLRASFFESHAWGWRLNDGHAPDGDMPRAECSPYAQSTLWACVVDARRAFDVLNALEKRRLFKHVVLGLSQVEIAAGEGVTQGAVWQTLRGCERKMLEFLNGDEGE